MTVFAIITSFFGLVTGLEFAHRSWRLVQVSDEYRPLGSKGRWRFDWTHYTMSVGYTYMTAVLVGASIPHEPLVRPLAMPAALFLLQLGLQLLATGLAGGGGSLGTPLKAPCAISSVPRSKPVPPLALTLAEDVVAVDGGGARTWRRELMDRYSASSCFRSMVAQVNWLWAVGAISAGTATMAALWAVEDETIAYGIGQSLSFFGPTLLPSNTYCVSAKEN